MIRDDKRQPEKVDVYKRQLFMDAGSRVEYGRAEGLMEESMDCHPINAYGKAKWEFYNRADVYKRQAMNMAVDNTARILVFFFIN